MYIQQSWARWPLVITNHRYNNYPMLFIPAYAEASTTLKLVSEPNFRASDFHSQPTMAFSSRPRAKRQELNL